MASRGDVAVSLASLDIWTLTESKDVKPNRAKEALLTAERAREILSYDPETGVLRWRHRVSQRMLAGAVAGTLDGYGYIRIIVDGRTYRAHRLAWLIVHGEWPKNELDHKNLLRSDNRLCNLREATRLQNMQNKKVYKNNTSGHTGIFEVATGFRAVYGRNGRIHRIGIFPTLESAISAREAAIAYRGEFRSSH